MLNLAIYSNLSSVGSTNTFGAMALEQIARTSTSLSDLKLNFVNYPLKANFQYTAMYSPAFTANTFLYCLSLFMGMALQWMYRHSGRVDSGFYRNVIMRGGTKGGYLVGHACCQIFFYLEIGTLIWAVTAAMISPVPYMGVPIIMWAVSEILFLTLIFDLFSRTGICQTGTVVGLIGLQYILISVLG